MSRKYLVGSGDSEFKEQGFAIVNADNPQEALIKYVRVIGVYEDTFLGYLYEKSVNMSFAENFWLQKEEEQELFNDNGSIEVDDDEFKRRVRDFFKEHHDFASHYINYYFGDYLDTPEPDYFPVEMRVFMFLNDTWAEGFIAIPMTDLQEI
jgi:hypothetical protein